MTLYVLVGMIGSGKSTYAKKRACEGALVIALDDLVAMVHAHSHRPAYPSGYEPGLRYCYRRLEEGLVANIVCEGRDVVIDRTHLTRESRVRWITFGRWIARIHKPLEIVAVRFPILTPEEHAKRRVASDPRGRTAEEWLMVARHHAEQAAAEPLDASEGFDRIVEADHGHTG